MWIAEFRESSNLWTQIAPRCWAWACLFECRQQTITRPSSSEVGGLCGVGRSTSRDQVPSSLVLTFLNWNPILIMGGKEANMTHEKVGRFVNSPNLHLGLGPTFRLCYDAWTIRNFCSLSAKLSKTHILHYYQKRMSWPERLGFQYKTEMTLR